MLNRYVFGILRKTVKDLMLVLATFGCGGFHVRVVAKLKAREAMQISISGVRFGHRWSRAGT